MIVFYLMLLVSSGNSTKRQELNHFMQAEQCEQLRDTLNSVRLAPGRFECWLGIHGTATRIAPKGKEVNR